LPHVEALVLAAGLSSRMRKGNKLLLELSGRAVIEHVLESLLSSRVRGVTVVIGNQKEKIRPVLEKYDVKIVENPCFASGMSSSIRKGIESLPAPAGAVIILPGDMPLIRLKTFNNVLDAYAGVSRRIVCPVYRGKRGHPVLFDKGFFPELLQLSGDVGARSILRKYSGNIVKVEVDDPGILADIDSWEDYLAANSAFKEEGL